ncbi:hypothetical protein [Ovoidimarina sediminis]|uniref:hypothetical protein n=1 Tax=Ovoidimarina sediminis TaxID=3079856 RepID=UPI00290BD6BB|nr:hypothetical protein [Rhodophyticola sp. MJ-SS7]MDU8944084.1 hypothetical protein [Rhodophyticola sp. MJ-SS7]
MTDEPINLDGRRSTADQREAKMRRRPANSASPAGSATDPQRDALEEQMLAKPARSWIEVMKKWRFLIDRYAVTPEAEDARIQKLIRRALGDMERLRKREERK